MSQLISLAGGPLFGERPRRSKRRIEMTLNRQVSGEWSEIFNTTMENELIIPDSDPVLQDGDIFTMEAVVRQGFSVRDLFPIISAVASITLVITRLRD